MTDVLTWELPLMLKLRPLMWSSQASFFSNKPFSVWFITFKTGSHMPDEKEESIHWKKKDVESKEAKH